MQFKKGDKIKFLQKIELTNSNIPACSIWEVRDFTEDDYILEGAEGLACLPFKFVEKYCEIAPKKDKHNILHKYKVGDKVRVRKDLERMKVYGGKLAIDSMTFFRGRIVTIARDNCVDDVYTIKEDGERTPWTDEMFEGLAVNEAPSITKRINNKHNILNGLLNSDGSVDGEKLMEKLEENQVQVANGVVMNDKPQRPTESASTPASTGREEKFKEGDKLQFVKDYKFPHGGSILKGSVWKIAIVNIEIYTLLYIGGENSISGKCGYNINLPLEVLSSHCEKVEDSEEAKTKGSYYEKSAMQPLEVMQRVMTPEQFKGFIMGNCIKYRMRCDQKGQHDSDLYKAKQYAYWLELVQQGKIINPSIDIVPDGYEFKII